MGKDEDFIFAASLPSWQCLNPLLLTLNFADFKICHQCHEPLVSYYRGMKQSIHLSQI